MEVHADRLRRAVRSAAKAIVGTSITDVQFDRMRIQPQYGGGNLLLPDRDHMHAFFLGTYITNRRRILKLASAAGMHVDMTWYDEAARRAQADLRNVGVDVNMYGRVGLTQYAFEVLRDSPLANDVPQAATSRK